MTAAVRKAVIVKMISKIYILAPLTFAYLYICFTNRKRAHRDACPDLSEVIAVPAPVIGTHIGDIDPIGGDIEVGIQDIGDACGEVVEGTVGSASEQAYLDHCGRGIGAFEPEFILVLHAYHQPPFAFSGNCGDSAAESGFDALFLPFSRYVGFYIYKRHFDSSSKIFRVIPQG
jgi:hypothetical protein